MSAIHNLSEITDGAVLLRSVQDLPKTLAAMRVSRGALVAAWHDLEHLRTSGLQHAGQHADAIRKAIRDDAKPAITKMIDESLKREAGIRDPFADDAMPPPAMSI